jgi:methylmalonyl-CoA/ethylmalonyl-CoA epimerase
VWPSGRHSEIAATFVDHPHWIARLPDHELWMVFLRDPDAHLLALMAERPLA